MFGAFVRGAAAFVLGILLWTPLTELIDVILGVIEPQLGPSATSVWALKTIASEWPLVLLAAIAMTIVARAAVESTLGRGV